MQRLDGALLWLPWKGTECVLWEARRPHMPLTMEETDSWAPKSVLFFLGTQMGLYFPVSLVGRCSHVAQFSPVEYEWKWRVPVSGLACADLTRAASHALPFLPAGCRQEGSRASVLTWGSWTQRSGGSMNLDGKSISSFSLTLNWNLAFLSMTNADDKLQ